MYEVKWVDGDNLPGYWAIFKDAVQQSGTCYKDEWEAIHDVIALDCEQGLYLLNLH